MSSWRACGTPPAVHTPKALLVDAASSAAVTRPAQRLDKRAPICWAWVCPACAALSAVENGAE